MKCMDTNCGFFQLIKKLIIKFKFIKEFLTAFVRLESTFLNSFTENLCGPNMAIFYVP